MRIAQVAPLWERVPHAIEIAKATGIPLKMAGKIDPVDLEFFDREIKPQIDGEFIQFLRSPAWLVGSTSKVTLG